MKEDIYIIGSGGFAKEVYSIVKTIKKFNFLGFVDSSNQKSQIELFGENLPIIEEQYFLNNIQNVNIIFGVGNPKLIHKLVKKFINYKFPNIIHPTHTQDYDNIKMGIGNVITQNVVFTTNIQIGSFNIFNLNTTVGHDCVIGDMNVINPSVNISGNCKIGNMNLFGVSSVVLENLEIGNNNIIGASALMNKKINNNGVYVGIPSKFLKTNE